jgi:acyl-CoA reductase-like NAD-dependent aldehyde dehydrogenase
MPNSYTIPARYDLYIGGGWQTPRSPEAIASVSPLTGAVLTVVPDAGPQDVDAAVSAAAAAFPAWSCTSPQRRQKILDALADRLVQDIDRIAWLESSDTGKPWRESRANVNTAADRLRYFAAAARMLEGGVLPFGTDMMSLNLRKPLGVVGIMGAWNFPLNMFVGKIAPALAAGNTVVYKPAETAPITTLEIAALFGELLPAGVLNVLTGRGETTGAAIVAHPGVRKISVTGSTETGRLVMRDASHSLKRLTLELGGKNAQIICPDADLDRAAQGVVLGAFMNQGQVCTAGSRIFVHRDVRQAFTERLLDLIGRLRIGDPFDPSTHMGTMISAEHLEHVLGYVDVGKAEGARVLCGGVRLAVPGWPDGLFMQPTLLDDVQPAMRVAQEEIFGPIAALLDWSDEGQLLEAVNGVSQGLAAGIWTADLARAHRIAGRIEAGRIWVNCYNLFPSGAAFGGTKASGFGREDAFETLFDFTKIKNVIIDANLEYRRFYE